MAETNILFRVILAIVVSAVVAAAITGIFYTISHPEKTYTKATTTEYRVFEHDIEPFRVYTSQGIFLIQTQEELDQLELNHTYTCEETYSNISLANCTEIKGE